MATMVVKRVKDTETKKVFMHKIADIRGGVAIKTSELGGDYIPEGTVLSAPSSGICHVVKVAQLTAEYSSNGTTIQVSKGSLFKVGDQVMTKTGGKAYAITKIDVSNKQHDVITVKTAIDTARKDEFIMEAASESTADSSKLKHEPLAVVGTGKTFKAGENVDTDAWLIGVTKGNALPADIAGKLKGIINY